LDEASFADVLQRGVGRVGNLRKSGHFKVPPASHSKALGFRGKISR
jgi:hypothetical protein